MKEYYRALSSDENNPPIEVDITGMTPAERYAALNGLKAQVDASYTIKYHICDHTSPAGGCVEEPIE